MPGLFQALWMSFYSRDVYVAAATQWRGTGVLYLLLLLTVSWLPSGIRWFTGLQTFVVTSGQSVIGQLPTVIIEGGVMRANPSGRHEIHAQNESGLEQTFLIIDDTIDEVPAESESDVMVLTRLEFGQIRPSRNERRVWTLGPEAEMVVTPDDVNGVLSLAPIVLPPIGYIVAVVGSLLVRIGQGMLFGAMGLAIARRRDVDLDYGGAMRLAVVAMTPWVLIRTLLWFGPWEPDWYFRWPIAIAITSTYMLFGLRAVEED